MSVSESENDSSSWSTDGVLLLPSSLTHSYEDVSENTSANQDAYILKHRNVPMSDGTFFERVNDDN
ncbi:hypothetical protein ILUMI_11801, partial [Ignelater luminosus]